MDFIMKPEWVEGMDCGHEVPYRVNELITEVEDAKRTFIAGDAVDYSIAIAMHDAKDVGEFAQHLDYIISQLQKFAANVRAGLL